MYTMNISHKEYSVIKDSSIKKRNPKNHLEDLKIEVVGHLIFIQEHWAADNTIQDYFCEDQMSWNYFFGDKNYLNYWEARCGVQKKISRFQRENLLIQSSSD